MRKFKHLKIFEDFANQEMINDIILKGGAIEVENIKNLGDKEIERDKDTKLYKVKPVSCDDKSVTIEIDNNYYEVDYKDIKLTNL
jgi:hypothetical protein